MQQTVTAAVVPLRPPVLFLHIPKTAGTSFLAVLANAFGETRMRRLADGETEGPVIAALLAAPEMADIRCLAGHFPLHMFKDRLADFRVFTILRHPVERVLSLYRFLRRRTPFELARMGLREEFGFDEFLACRSPEVFGQVRNGMCRLLCGNPALTDGDSNLFWRQRLPDRLVVQAVAALRDIEFGLAEEMGGTLALARRFLGVPFPLTEHVENVSKSGGPERTVANILRLIELNTGDIALYREALDIFHTRLQQLAAAARDGGDATEIAEVAQLGAGVKVRIRDIPGRQGFHGYEDGPEFAWLVGSTPSRLAFAATPGRKRLFMRVYRCVDAYPVEELDVAVNGTSVPHRHVRLDESWSVVETALFEVESMNLLTLTAPYTVAARFLVPASEDRRQLSLALSEIMLDGA